MAPPSPRTGRGDWPLPPALVTGVGSLPFTDPADAVEFVARHSPQLPFWPQLPRRTAAEGMLDQGLARASSALHAGDGGATGWAVGATDVDRFVADLAREPAPLDDDVAAGLGAFERAVGRGGFPDAVALKGQLTGPLTLAWYLRCGAEPAVARPDVVEALASWVRRRAVAQVERLSALGLPVLVVLDEPALGLADRSRSGAWVAAGLRGACAAIRDAGGLAGVHCCGSVPFDRLRRIGADVVSVDATLPGMAPWHDPIAAAYWATEGAMALGVVPTDAPADIDARITSDLSALPAALAARTIVTATCGLAGSTPDGAARSFAVAHRVADGVRQRAEGAIT